LPVELYIHVQHHLGIAKQNGGSTKPANQSKGKSTFTKLMQIIGKNIIEILGD